MRVIKIILIVAAFIALSYFISTIRPAKKQGEPIPDMIYGFPTYPGSQFNKLMSGLNGDPYTAVFLSEDSYEKVVKFYKEKLKRDYKLLKYGRNAHVSMEVYQFSAQPGDVVETYINRGVEVIPLNARNQTIYHAKTKIKIMVPRKEVLEAAQKKRQPSTTRSRPANQ